MRVVLLSGKQGSGKTTLQKSLVEKWFQVHGRQPTVVNFADILYEMHNAVLTILHQYWPNRKLVKDGPLLQMLGTDWGRNTIDENIWVKILQNKVSFTTFKPNDLVVVGDCRFPNEFDAFPGALRVRLNAPEGVRKERVSMWRENSNHASETGLDEYDKQGKFDIYLDTQMMTADLCMSLVFVALEKESWVERRK